MKAILQRSILTAVVTMLTALPALAQDSRGPAKNIESWSFGESLVGEPVDTKSLKGKVVVIEYWGVR